MTTQQFVETEGYRSLGEVGIVFIDGYHSEEQARFDYEAFEDLVPSDGIIPFHDSMSVRSSEIYGPNRAYRYSVKFFIDKLRERSELQVTIELLVKLGDCCLNPIKCFINIF